MHTGLSKPFRHINMPLYHLKNPVDLELMADKIIQSCTGDQSLYIVDTFQQICLPAAIQLRKNIIQQKHRCIPDLNTSKIATLWDAVFSEITTNPFQITFADLTGITLTAGIWNSGLQRLEC